VSARFSLWLRISLLASALVVSAACSGESTSRPELPITLQYREAALGMGYVITFQNTSDRFLSLRVSAHNPTMNQRATMRLDIGPRSQVEWGWLEGWPFTSGDIISIEHADYALMRRTVP
jgi:hypothetical protein